MVLAQVPPRAMAAMPILSRGLPADIGGERLQPPRIIATRTRLTTLTADGRSNVGQDGDRSTGGEAGDCRRRRQAARPEQPDQIDPRRLRGAVPGAAAGGAR